MSLAELLAGHKPGPRDVAIPFVIAEAGVNHEGSMEIARRLIDEAREGGADAIKFQTYRAETIAAADSPAYWDTTKEPTRNQRELFRKYDRFWKAEFEELRRHCDTAGIEFLSTPFDLESATFLNDLMGSFKIASADLTNIPFVEHIASFGKPIVLSTGASNLWEIEETAATIRAAAVPFAVLHCVLNYPTARTDANLGMIPDLGRHIPDATLGYSDHTEPDPDGLVLTTAMLLGARVIEKHFTHDKTLPGNDHYHAMDREDLRRYRVRFAEVMAIVGTQRKAALPGEEPARRNARRSLVAARPIAAGAAVVEDDLTWKRPGHGISPKELHELVGRVAREAIDEDTVLQWSMFG
jgi:N-acetylneuraminate synthase